MTILIAEDDPEDRMLARDALSESKLANAVEFVEDGQELLDYLRRQGGSRIRRYHPHQASSSSI